jgi:hypothetical protein
MIGMGSGMAQIFIPRSEPTVGYGQVGDKAAPDRYREGENRSA